MVTPRESSKVRLNLSRCRWGGGEELSLKQVHLFLTLWQSQFLQTFLFFGGGGEGGEISDLKTASAIFDPRLESVSSDFIVGSESVKNYLFLGCPAESHHLLDLNLELVFTDPDLGLVQSIFYGVIFYDFIVGSESAKNDLILGCSA